METNEKLSPGNISPTQAETGGGCFKTAFPILAIILLFGGICFTLVGGVARKPSCERGDKYFAELKQLDSELQTAKGTPEEASLNSDIKIALGGLESVSKKCYDERTFWNRIFIVGVLSAFVGLIMTIISFMTGRKKRAF